jgi:hypothetical protein
MHTLPSLATTMHAPCMKRSLRRTLVWSRFSSMQYIHFGCTLPSLATTLRAPCMKCSMHRTPVSSRYSSMQFVHFGCSASTTSCKEAELLFVDTQLKRINGYSIRQECFSWMKTNQEICRI